MNKKLFIEFCFWACHLSKKGSFKSYANVHLRSEITLVIFSQLCTFCQNGHSKDEVSKMQDCHHHHCSAVWLFHPSLFCPTLRLQVRGCALQLIVKVLSPRRIHAPCALQNVAQSGTFGRCEALAASNHLPELSRGSILIRADWERCVLGKRKIYYDDRKSDAGDHYSRC